MRRGDLERIAKAAEAFGLELRHAAGVDMLVRPAQPANRRAVRLSFAGGADLEPYRRIRGPRLIPLADLVRMKLTSFRAHDEAHLKDLDDAGLITPEIEAGLSPILGQRLAQVRARG